MKAAVLLAVALLVWPGGIAAGRVRALGADGARQAGGAGQVGGAGAARLRYALAQVPTGVLWPVAAGTVALVAVGPIHACAAAVLGGTAADLHGRATERRQRLARLGAWERALDDTSSALRAGAGPGGALGQAADAAAAHDPRVAGILAAAGSHARLGGDVAAALRPAGGDGPDGDRVAGELAGAWLLATRHGVVLAEVVDGLRADVASRRQRALRVDATLAGPRATSVILTALPGLGVLLGSGFGADPLGVLGSGALGGALCLAGAVLLAAGLLWTDRIAGGAAR
ncbi:type II secretion system F family protein [Dietzia kunjamensis]|uniref:type II secretion system F family protein n=1 Tax=Dietzia kunjamensis TaxID=322509 RepID=UPI002DBF83D0|nr:type II secretion system F family protein [Dietzia kunjamensis]MEB8325587.1 type II secretion system F family protein [Dietzia kunjamensis]